MRNVTTIFKLTCLNLEHGGEKKSVLHCSAEFVEKGGGDGEKTNR